MSIASFVSASSPFALVLNCLLPAMLLATSVAQSPTPAAATKSTASDTAPVVGVIDIGKAIEQYPVFIQMRTELDKRYATYQEQLKASAAKLEELRGTVQVMSEGTPERTEADFQYKLAGQTLDFQRNNFSERLSVEELRMMLLAYEDLDYAVAEVAKRKSVSLVMPKRDIYPSAAPIAEMGAKEVQDRVAAYQRRSVWFAANEVDLTGDVIKFMMVPLPDRNSPERAPKKSPPKKEGK